ncbi:hypothetical protein [Niabella ginsengisoli]|uniref:Uncharacterized protein n=1 Tax=Niabella ginsengisoli TaxID=522298 RepID=A0ABS9SDW9_9BACT|nr:hypothetical protein [Niabella ginsengisoli]MCH5596552.1 hypothetical protein [Niabella ginsengisoli]
MYDIPVRKLGLPISLSEFVNPVKMATINKLITKAIIVKKNPLLEKFLIKLMVAI